MLVSLIFSNLNIIHLISGEAQIDQAIIQKVLDGDLQLLFISPESLLNNKKFRSMLLKGHYKERLIALAVDEAHCIKTWLVCLSCVHK